MGGGWRIIFIMIRKAYVIKTQIERIPTEEGDSIEEMLRKATANNEPLDATAPMIYTAEADGVMPEYDIRTDKFELALDATDKFSKSERAKVEVPTPESETPKEE